MVLYQYLARTASALSLAGLEVGNLQFIGPFHKLLGHQGKHLEVVADQLINSMKKPALT